MRFRPETRQASSRHLMLSLIIFVFVLSACGHYKTKTKSIEVILLTLEDRKVATDLKLCVICLGRAGVGGGGVGVCVL